MATAEYRGPVLPAGVQSASPPAGNTPAAPVTAVVVRTGAPPPGEGFILVQLLCVVDHTFEPGLKFGGEVRNVGPNPAGSSGEAFAVSVHKVKANPVLRGVEIHPVSTFGAPTLGLGFEDGGFSLISALAAALLRGVGLVHVQQKASLSHLHR